MFWVGECNFTSSINAMTLAQHFIPEERVVKSVTEEVVLDLQPNNIERVFHLPRVDQFIRLSYETIERWYREYQ